MRKIYIQKSLALLVLWCFYLVAWAQIPSGYYDSATGKNERELKTALFHIIQNLNPPSYGKGSGSTWAAFEKTDRRPDSSVWDMYSTEVRYFSNDGQSVPGMNIEHSFPKSWWGYTEQDLAYRDILQLRPSDASANSAKNNYIMAVVDGSVSFDNGCTKVGTTTCPGKTVSAWEPANEYKGDFARMYMYMVTCYEDYADRWRSAGLNQLQNNTYPVFQDWTAELLLQWNEQDPVSEKEEVLNNEAYKIQRNRNPFIDYPMLAEYIWGDLKEKVFDPTEIAASRTLAPVFSKAGGYYSSPFEVSLACATDNAEIYYTLDESLPSRLSLKYVNPIQINAERTIVKAIAVSSELDDSRISTVTYNIGKDPNIAESIRELRTFSADDATTYTLKLNHATVTFCDDRYLFLQDDESAICVYGSSASRPVLEIGYSVSGEISGKLKDFYSLLEINDPTFNLSVSFSEQPEPALVTIADLQNNFERYDSRLIQLNDIIFESTVFDNKNVSIHHQSASSTITCRNQFNRVYGSLPEEAVNLMGIAIPYYQSPQIALRGDFDIHTVPTGLGHNESRPLSVRVQQYKLILSADSSIAIEISDIVGRSIMRFMLESGEKEISLNPGIYIVNGIKVIL